MQSVVGTYIGMLTLVNRPFRIDSDSLTLDVIETSRVDLKIKTADYNKYNWGPHKYQLLHPIGTSFDLCNSTIKLQDQSGRLPMIWLLWNPVDNKFGLGNSNNHRYYMRLEYDKLIYPDLKGGVRKIAGVIKVSIWRNIKLPGEKIIRTRWWCWIRKPALKAFRS